LSRRLKSVIKAAGKRSYTFAVGKINVPKLANFADIDAFVVVACEVRIQRARVRSGSAALNVVAWLSLQMNSIFNNKEFYRPIITPYELELALVPHKEWDGGYNLDFRSVAAQPWPYVHRRVRCVCWEN